MSTNNKKNIIVIGASGHAKVVIDILERQNQYNIIGLIDSYKSKEKKIFHYKILGTEDDLLNLMHDFNFNFGIIAIGDNWTRKLVYDKIINLAPDFEFITAIHPNATIGKNVKIGIGTVIMPCVIINSDSEVGDFCVLNTRSSLDHDGNMKNFSSLAPNSCIGGNVTIGEYSAVCLGANIIQDIAIGKHSIIGAGSLVNKNVADYNMVYGVPAKSIRRVSKGEKYLYHINDFTKPKEALVELNSHIEVITGKNGWDALLEGIEHHDFYHTFDYHNLSKQDNEIPKLIKYVEGNTIIAIPILTRIIQGTIHKDATSVYGYAGPITKNLPLHFDNSNFQKKLTEYFYNNNFVSVFSRLNPFISDQNRVLENIGNIISQGKVVNINIQEDLEIQRQKFQSRLKTHINKARRCCTIKEATTDEDIMEFIDIYYENMDRVKAKKSYYFSKAYFQNMTKSPDFESKILIAVDNETGQSIAACQFIITNGIVQYHLSGTKNDFLHLTPTKLLIDEMRIIATKRGYKFYNLGGGLGGRDDDSLFFFKSSFSKDFKEFNLWKLIVNQEVYDELVAKKGINTTSEYFPLYRIIDDLNVQ